MKKRGEEEHDTWSESQMSLSALALPAACPEEQHRGMKLVDNITYISI